MSAMVDIVVPVYNEEAALPGSIRRLHDHLTDGFPFGWRIVIADNASCDGTLDAAHTLAGELDGVEVLHLDEKGRGRALRAAWASSRAPVVCYMDVDLSTDPAHSCRWSHRSCPATATWPSDRGSPAAREPRAARSAS
jgi:glycosyltransferase involved in cell wall biosynthesis